LSTKPLFKKVSKTLPTTRFQHYDDLCRAGSSRENYKTVAEANLKEEKLSKLKWCGFFEIPCIISLQYNIKLQNVC